MFPSAWPLFAVIAIGLLLAVGWLLHTRSIGSEQKWLPKELRDAELVYAEKVFRSGGTMPIVAKCDRGYRTKKGVIILVELKTRRVNRTYLSDVIELSAQRFSIQMQNGENVAEYGYVLVQRPGGKSKYLHRVKLLLPEEILALARRREVILTDIASAATTCSKGLCQKCAYCRECHSQETS
jgi:CRISPR-associated exonuclease Cas4